MFLSVKAGQEKILYILTDDSFPWMIQEQVGSTECQYVGKNIYIYFKNK
jgi:hypothetical protein